MRKLISFLGVVCRAIRLLPPRVVEVDSARYLIALAGKENENDFIEAEKSCT